MFSSPNTHDNNTNFFALAVVRGIIVAGLCTLGGAVLISLVALPLQVVLGASSLIGGVVFFRDFSHVSEWLDYVWRERQEAEAARLRFEAQICTGQWPDAPQLMHKRIEAETPPQPTDHPVTVNHPKGSYTLPAITPEEIDERYHIGQALTFLTLAERAKGFSERTMQAVRPPHYTESAFEKWWTKTSDQMAEWGILEKGERQATRLSNKYPTFDLARTALLRRSFLRHRPIVSGADSQTDSQTATPATA